MPYAELIIWAMLGALVLYALLAGADFGGGMWDLLAWGPRQRQQREALAHAIGPVWEANHVWLILVLVLLFTAFPPAFGAIMTALFVPMALVLVGIVLRGAAFVFRKYDTQRDAVHARWSLVFGVASLATPFFLGLGLGALATGTIRLEGGLPMGGFVAGWTTPFAVACGLFAQGLFAFLAAVYMTVETVDAPALQDDFRRRALASGLALAPVAAAVFWLARTGAPVLYEGLTAWWAPALLGATSLCALGALGALWRRRYAWARLLAGGQVALILVGWGLAQYPYLIIPDLTFAEAAAPEVTLRLLTYALGAGALVLFPSLYLLFRVFKHQ